MRTTIRMNDGLAREIKRLASASNRTFTQIIEEACTLLLAASRRTPGRQKKIILPTHGRKGGKLDVDFSTNAAALGAMNDGLPIHKLR